MSLFEQVQAAKASIERQVSRRPQVGIVLGSGLGGLVDSLDNPVSIPYSQIPGFGVSTVPGHAGRLVLGSLRDVPLVVLQGRVHYYEGYSLTQVTFPTRVLCALGIHSLVVTNAAGGVRADLAPGDLMIITDHLNLTGSNPLTGPNDERFGPRFPDLSNAYHPMLRQALIDTAQERQIALKQGIYAWLSGPSYETPAEVRMLGVLGADAVGMSTVPEVIVAAHSGVRVAGISCITNQAAGNAKGALSHADVARIAEQAHSRITDLLTNFLPRIASAN